MHRNAPTAPAARLLPTLFLLTVLSGCTAPDGGTDPEPDALGFDFGQGLDGWSQDSDVPEDPNNPGERVAWRIDTVEDKGRGPSVRYVLDGRQDDGTVWLERGVSPGPGRYHVEVRIDAWSASESFNTLAYLVSHLGTDDPGAEEDFPQPGTASSRGDERGGVREALDQAEGWRTYTYAWTTPDLESGDALWFAVGISAVWETEMTYYVDNVELHFTPA